MHRGKEGSAGLILIKIECFVRKTIETTKQLFNDLYRQRINNPGSLETTFR